MVTCGGNQATAGPPTPNAIAITAPQNNATVSGTTAITLSKTSSVSWVNVYIDGTYFASTPPLTLNWNSAIVSDGPHTISAGAYASSGTLVGTATVHVVVQNGATPTPTAVPTVVPTATNTPSATPSPVSTAIAITAPTDNATLAGTVSIVVSEGSSVSWVNLYIDGDYFASTPPSNFSWDSTTVSDGQHTISATAYSSSGTNLGTASINVTVQNSAVQITAPAQGATVAGTAVTITVARNTGVAWVNLYLDGDYFASTPPFSLSWDSTTVTDGTHTISATGYTSDSAVAGTASVTVTVAN